MADQLLDTDWAAHWRALVEARNLSGAGADPNLWDRRASAYGYSMEGWRDPFLDVIEPWLDPGQTLIDAGAGTGRHVAALAPRLDWVTAVEPSTGMRARIPGLDNVTVIASRWEDADPAPADLVICCHVLYGVADAVPFIRHLEAAARQRVFIYLRDHPQDRPADRVWELITGRTQPRQPLFGDLYNLLRSIGVRPDVTFVRYPAVQRFPSMEAAIEDTRVRAGAAWDERVALDWLQRNLVADGSGGVAYQAGDMVSGVAHWRP